MIFHVVSLPHTNTTSEFVVCAFTEKVRRFCNMMKAQGHTVYLYAGTQNEADCDELITCISEKDRREFLGDKHYVDADFNYNLPTWKAFNNRAIQGIKERIGQHDFICLIGGLAQKQIADALPDHMSVEFGIGYGGTFSKYRVFESYAWMHTCYGSGNPNPNAIDGGFYDAVIPNYFEVDKFPFRETKDDYYLFIGRLTERKGFQVAADVCEKLGERLVVAGGGTPPTYGEYVGLVDEKERGRLMSGAKAVFVPTIYVEPFGGVAIEAMLCGTPIITTDWGAFAETNIHGVTGYRARTFAEFQWAAQNVGKLSPRRIRRYAERNYSMDRVGRMYQAYFEQLLTLWGEGWMAPHEVHPDRYRRYA